MKKNLNPKKPNYYEAVGRRKEAVARVRLYPTAKDKKISVNNLMIRQGEIYLNKKPIEKIFSSFAEKALFMHPLVLTGSEEKFAISIHVRGGGKRGQLDAAVHGLSRALEKADRQSHRAILKKTGLLKRDSRIRERRKVGTGGKARRQKQSPKR